jgi:hypothetical protein
MCHTNDVALHDIGCKKAEIRYIIHHYYRTYSTARLLEHIGTAQALLLTSKSLKQTQASSGRCQCALTLIMPFQSKALPRRALPVAEKCGAMQDNTA